MTIRAFNEVDIVRTVLVKVCSTHFCYVEPAVRDGRVTVDAALARIVAVGVVACRAT